MVVIALPSVTRPSWPISAHSATVNRSRMNSSSSSPGPPAAWPPATVSSPSPTGTASCCSAGPGSAPSAEPGSTGRGRSVVGRSGVSDRALTSRRLPLLWVLLFTQIVGLALVVPFAVAHGGPTLEPRAILAAMAGSLAGLVGIAGLYRAIALGVASIAAPISATGAILPVVFGLARGDPATTLQEVGMGCALLGVIAASRTGEAQAHLGRDARLGVGFALVA